MKMSPIQWRVRLSKLNRMNWGGGAIFSTPGPEAHVGLCRDKASVRSLCVRACVNLMNTFGCLNIIRSWWNLVSDFISMKTRKSSIAVKFRPNLVELWALFRPKFAKSGFGNTFVCLNIIRSQRNLVCGFISMKCRTSSNAVDFRPNLG